MCQIIQVNKGLGKFTQQKGRIKSRKVLSDQDLSVMFATNM
jgi:hypothetical protein